MTRHRILHLRASNFVGGPEQQLLRYAESERAAGLWEILLGTFVGAGEGSEFLRAIETRGLTAVPLPASSWAAALHGLIQTVRRERVELLCAHGYRSDVLGLVASRLLRIPCVCFLRGWIGENYKVRVYEQIDRRAIRFADRVVCLSESQAKKISHYVNPTKIKIVCNAIDTPCLEAKGRERAQRDLRERFNLPLDSMIVASAGRLSPEKGVGDFLTAISRIRSLPSNTHFVIFGDGALRPSLEKKVRRLNLQNRVTFAGFHSDMRSLLPGFDLLVNPSLSEEMPNIILEAMAAGIPVVATNVGGVADIAGPDEAVYLVPPADSQTLADAIRELTGNSQYREKLAEKGLRRVRQAFSLSVQQSQLRSLYEEVLTPQSLRRAANNSVEEDSASANCFSKPTDFVSIVVPVRNEENHIASVLRELEAQDYPRDLIEVLVVDGNSTDRTAAIVQEIAGRAAISIRLLMNPAQLSSAGRNVGARNARGKFVLYIDGHCQIPSKTLVRDAVELFEKTNAYCLCRPQPLTMPGNTVFQEVVAHARATPLGHARDSTIFTTNWEGPVNPSSSGAMYRREVFDRVGFFDERLDACEDVDFNYRVFKAGLPAFYSAKLKIIYEPRKNLRSFWKQMARYGQGRYRLIRKHPDACSASQIVPAAFLVWLLVGGIAALSSSWLASVFLTSVAAYAGVVLLFSGRLAFKYGWGHFFIAPAVFVCLHAGLGAGFLGEFLRSKWRRRMIGASATEARIPHRSSGASSLMSSDRASTH